MDVRKALSALHTCNEHLARKALQRLHIRWRRAATEQLSQVLGADGAPLRALAVVPAVITACQVSRVWQRPSRNTVSLSSFSTAFKEAVWFDLLSYESLLGPRQGCVATVISLTLGRDGLPHTSAARRPKKA